MLKRLIFTLTLLTLGALNAQEGQIETRLDYLVWKPFGANINWASQTVPPTSIPVPNKTIFVLSPSYRSGVRAEIGYRSGCSSIRALGRYFWVEHKESVRLANPNTGQIPGLGNSSEMTVINNRGGFAASSTEIGAVGRARLKQPFHAADLLLGYDLCMGSPFQATVIGGGTFLYLDRSFQAFFLAFDPNFGPTTGFTPYSTRTRFVGGGPSIGIQGEVPVWRLCLTGEVSIASLIGRRLNRSQGGLAALFPQPFVRLVNPTMTGLALGLFANVGVSYKQQWCGRCLGVQLGWEQRAYHNVSSIRHSPGIFSANSASIAASVDILFLNLGGPYAGLSIEF